ncbi:MAG: hypothetical protein ABEN55_07695, partial [Bradymonadaceae bacterium]
MEKSENGRRSTVDGARCPACTVNGASPRRVDHRLEAKCHTTDFQFPRTVDRFSVVPLLVATVALATVGCGGPSGGDTGVVSVDGGGDTGGGDGGSRSDTGGDVGSEAGADGEAVEPPMPYADEV